MTRIAITPERMRQVAGQFKQASSQGQEMVTRLQGTMADMATQWEGASKERFFHDYVHWQANMKQFVELLGSIGLQLDQIAQRFAAADQQGG